MLARSIGRLVLVAAAFGALSVSIGVGSAAAQELIATHGDWTVYTYVENGKKVCYTASRPAKQEGSFKKRSEPYAIVTRREIAKGAEEVSVTAGYPYKDGAKVEATIGGSVFTLVSQNEWAWAPNAAGDKEIVAAMVRGTQMTIRGESKVDTNSIDTYSLSGFSAARKAITEGCPA